MAYRCRAAALARLGEHKQARADYDAAIEVLHAGLIQGVEDGHKARGRVLEVERLDLAAGDGDVALPGRDGRRGF